MKTDAQVNKDSAAKEPVNTLVESSKPFVPKRPVVKPIPRAAV
jgi:hypothetical protein